MANPTNEEFINRIMEAESSGRRYDKNGKLLQGPKTKHGTAKGEMQVLDKTNFDPGFGVEPAKNKSPEERARVGRDYAKAMLDRYNDKQHAAMAYNWGPGNVDKWLAKGQSAPVPKETEDYVVKVTGAPIGAQVAKKPAASPFETAVAPAPAAAAGAPKAPASPPVKKVAQAAPAPAPAEDIKARIAALGPNYHAAMALSYLADNTDEDDPAIQSYRERMGEESERSALLSEPVVSPAIADLDLKVRSPFPEPVAAARGGLIHRAGGSPEEGEEVASDSDTMASNTDPETGRVATTKYGEQTPVYSFQGKEYPAAQGANLPPSRSKQALEAYVQAMVPDANIREKYPLSDSVRGFISRKDPSTINLSPILSPGSREETMLHEAEHSMDARGGDLLGRPKVRNMDNNYRAYYLMGSRWAPINMTVKNLVDNKDELEKFFGRPLDNSYFRKETYANVAKDGDPSALFSEQLATLSALEQQTGKFLTHDPKMRELIFPSNPLYNNTSMMAVYDALTGPRQTRMDARDMPPHTPVPSYLYEEPGSMSRFFRKHTTGPNEYGIPIKRADGSPKEGETKSAIDMLKEVGSGAVRNIKNLAIGASDTPYDLVGGPVDLATMAMRPFGYKTEKPVGGSEYLKEKATELGVRLPDSKDEQDQNFRLAGELAASFVNPASVVRGGLKAGAKAADMLRKATTAAPVEQAPAAAASLSAMATKKGATSMPFYSPLDQYAQTLTGPVSGEEFIKQLQNKGFRAYEVERAKEAMQNLGSGKVTPSQVMGALDETYHPESFITKIEEPGSVGYTFPDTDNVYYRGSKSPPMGVISLHLPITDEIKKGKELQGDLLDITGMSFNVNHPLIERNSLVKTAQEVADLTATQYGHSSQQARDAQYSFNYIKQAQKDMVPYLDKIPEYLQLKKQFQYPLAYGDPVRFSRLVDIKVKEGKSLDEVGDVAEDLRREAGAKILNFFDRVKSGIPQRSNSIFKDVARADDPLINDPYNTGYSSNMEMEFGEAEHIINRELKEFQNKIALNAKSLGANIPHSMSPRVGHGDLFINNYNEANPIAFSRFTDQSGYINQQKMDGMYVPELQSDLFRDIKSRGTQGQSSGNDLPKITKLTEEKNALEIQLEEARAARDKLDTRSPVDGSGLLGRGWAEASDKVTALRNKVAGKEEAITKIREKVYDVTPAFAGMENSPQVVQQLAAKNAVIAGIQRGKSFVAFPGAESDQAQLYEKLPRNLDQIIKDLGPGFVRQVVELPLPEGVHHSKLGQMISAGTVKYPTDARGMPLTNEPGRMLSEAIVWSPEAAARILKQGVRFRHGGSVERQSDDNRRYL